MSSLLTIKGYNMGVRYRLGDVTTIGRELENTIQLPVRGVSRLHAEIRRQRLAYTIYDKSDGNEVLVNGKKIVEKLLKRNDEIVIGSTHFLFDSDFEVKNTLFDNKSVYLCAPTAPTDYETVTPERAESFGSFQIGGLRLLERISDLIAASKVQLPRVSREILAGIVEMTGARRAAVLHWDSIAHELVPLAAHCDEEQMPLDCVLVQQVFHERRAILTSDVPLDLRYAEHPDAPGRAVSVIAVPIGTEAHCEGVLYVDSDQPDCFSLRDVAVLMAVGRLFYLALRVAQVHERVEANGGAPAQMVGESPPFRAVREQAARVAEYDTPVLITGETGTGKELLAREIHALSPRREGPFVAINCSAIPETLFESELFGYEKGAFTGAAQLTRGKIEVASGGTLFLDEIGEMNLAVQPKLLRFLQDQVFYRVGGARPIRSSVRIIAATNMNLRRMADEGRFRSDLMFRLNVMELHLPALRERIEDIPLLVDSFLKEIGRQIKKPIEGVTEEAMNRLVRHRWPGNIRELYNCLERAALLSDEAMLDAADFATLSGEGRALDRTAIADAARNESEIRPALAGKTLAEVERAHILAALERNTWNQGHTAQELGIHRNTLRNKIQEYGLTRGGR